jgi:hypothetical protein
VVLARRWPFKRAMSKLPWAKYRCQPFVAPFRNDVCGIGVKLGKNGTRYW